jgi:hypothetical protein
VSTPINWGPRHSNVPCDPLEPHLASPNRVLVGGVCIALPPTPSGLSCGSILLCDLRPRAARALHVRSASLAVLTVCGMQSGFQFSSTAKGLEKKISSASDAKRTWSARAARGLRSQSKIEPQESPEGVGGSAAHTPPTRTRFGEAR